jgi:LCP family protein required for cell wall assembly
VDRARADSIHLVGIDPAKGRASILGFPRDSWVEIPGYGTDKINASMVYGGPEAVVATVEALTGITVDYWALASFEGFQAMVNDVGGLVVDVPFPMSDPYARSDFQPGVQRLDGHDALAFARDRHSLSSGDLGRSENQGRLILAALAQFRKEFRKDPSRLLTWVAAGLRHVRTDLGIGEVLDLAFTASEIDPERVENMVVPGSVGMEGGQSVVFLSSAAVAIYRDMADDGFVSKANVPPSPELG